MRITRALIAAAFTLQFTACSCGLEDEKTPSSGPSDPADSGPAGTGTEGADPDPAAAPKPQVDEKPPAKVPAKPAK